MKVGSLNWFWVIWSWFSDLIRFEDINGCFFSVVKRMLAVHGMR